MSRATAEEFEKWLPGKSTGKFAKLRRFGKRRLRRIRRREERAFCVGVGTEPRPRHTGGWMY